MEETATVRSEKLFSPAEFHSQSLLIAGLGAGGSHAANACAKYGVAHLIGCDFDIVSSANIGPSIYGPAHVGWKKVDACADAVYHDTGVAMETYHCCVQDLPVRDMADVVFICVHDMDERREILLNHCTPASGCDPAKHRVRRVIESRMSARSISVFSIDPSNEDHVQEWLKYWFPSSAVMPPLPGFTGQVVSGAVAGIMGRIMAELFVQWWAFECGRAPVAHNQVRYDLSTFTGTSYVW